ncbi:MAG: hypothetical protein DIU70_013430 [Bacillota bacterium]|nr:MAG: hypothetical protein DIU70_06685 [Bacillota bacterium]
MAIRWQDLVDRLVDTDGVRLTEEQAIKALREFKETGSIFGVFFERMNLPHEDPEDASTWGPESPADVDWTGFPA